MLDTSITIDDAEEVSSTSSLSSGPSTKRSVRLPSNADDLEGVEHGLARFAVGSSGENTLESLPPRCRFRNGNNSPPRESLRSMATATLRPSPSGGSQLHDLFSNTVKMLRTRNRSSSGRRSTWGSASQGAYSLDEDTIPVSGPRKSAILFDGKGHWEKIPFVYPWVFRRPERENGGDPPFVWYHIEMPRTQQKQAAAAQYLIAEFYPRLNIVDVLALLGHGPLCATVNGALIFRINSAGPMSSRYTIKISARFQERSVISVSLGKIPHLEYNTGMSIIRDDFVNAHTPRHFTLGKDPRMTHSLSSLISSSTSALSSSSAGEPVSVQEHVLEFLLNMHHPEDADDAIPCNVAGLLVHIVDTYVDHLLTLVIKCEQHIDELEFKVDRDQRVKKEVLTSHLIPKMHLDLQRLLQAISHGEAVIPKLKEKASGKGLVGPAESTQLDSLVRKLKRLKDTVGFLVNRLTALQAGLDTWQAEQINKKLYVISVLSLIFIPLSLISGLFGMNVTGVPWVPQDPNNRHNPGFRNVLFICFAIGGLVLAIFAIPPLHQFVKSYRTRLMAKARWRKTSKKVLGMVRENMARRRGRVDMAKAYKLS